MDIQSFTYLTVRNPMQSKISNVQEKVTLPNNQKESLQKSSKKEALQSPSQPMNFHTLTDKEIQGLKEKYDVENMTEAELDELMQELIDLKAVPENLKQDLFLCQVEPEEVGHWVYSDDYEYIDYKPTNIFALLKDTVDRKVYFCNLYNNSINDDLTMSHINLMQIFETLKR